MGIAIPTCQAPAICNVTVLEKRQPELTCSQIDGCEIKIDKKINKQVCVFYFKKINILSCGFKPVEIPRVFYLFIYFLSGNLKH